MQELIRPHQTWKGYNSLSWVTQRVGHLALRWQWPQKSITWSSSACFKGWTGREVLTVPKASGLALVPTVSMALLKLPNPSTCAPPGTTAHPSTWTQTCPSLHLVPEVQFWPCKLTLLPAASIFRFFRTWALCVTSPPLSPLYVSIRFQLCPFRSLKPFYNLHT